MQTTRYTRISGSSSYLANSRANDEPWTDILLKFNQMPKDKQDEIMLNIYKRILRSQNLKEQRYSLLINTGNKAYA